MTQVGDAPIMALLIATGIFSIAQLCTLNRFRKFKKVHSIADVLLCDGTTVDSAILMIKYLANKGDHSAMFCIAIVRSHRWTSGWDH